METVDDGLTAYKERRYREAARIWTALSVQGEAEAQFNLGVLYKNGIGVPQDDSEAILWLRKASEQGHENAGLVLGVIEGESAPD